MHTSDVLQVGTRVNCVHSSMVFRAPTQSCTSVCQLRLCVDPRTPQHSHRDIFIEVNEHSGPQENIVDMNFAYTQIPTRFTVLVIGVGGDLVPDFSFRSIEMGYREVVVIRKDT